MQSLLSSFAAPLATPLANQFVWPLPFAICAVITFAIAFVAGLTIVATARWHSHISGDHLDEVQKIHSGQIPRIGGLAIFLALAYAGADLASSANHNLLLLLGLAALPAFVFGILEDFTNRVSVRTRFIATIIAGLLGCYVLEHSLHSVGFEVIDVLLSYTVVALAFTAIASAGLATSINMVDGLNGLSSFISIGILLGLAALASQAGDAAVHKVAVLGAFAIAGFALLNWPFGKIFLGDGGAYFIGFYIAWIAILLRSRDGGTISAFAMLLVCAYPIIETLFSMARRLGVRKLVGMPDQQHLHHLIYFLVKKNVHLSGHLTNSLAGVLTAMLAIPPILLAVQFSGDKAILIELFLCFVGLYLLLYLALQKWAAQVKFAHSTQDRDAPLEESETGAVVYSCKK